MEQESNNILVLTDFSEQSDICLEQACNLVNFLRSEITLLYVVPETAFFSKLVGIGQVFPSETEAKEKLKKIADDIFLKTNIKIKIRIEKGDPGKKTIQVEKELNPRYMIVSTKSYASPRSRIVSPTTVKVFRNSKCPVMTINGKEHFRMIKTILLPLDLTAETMTKLKEAKKLAGIYYSTLKLVSFVYRDTATAIVRLKDQLVIGKRYLDKRKFKNEVELIDKREDNVQDLAVDIADYANKHNVDLVMVVVQQEPEEFFIFYMDNIVKKLISLTEKPVLCIPAEKIRIEAY
ncbi:MAG: universal stress protein [Bacteroidales bacterium]|jgi:nucleotide-binding universal stress UspA family protein